MTGAKWSVALLCAAALWLGIGATQAAPDDSKDDSKDDAKANCLASPKGTPPAGEKWFYRVERGTKRHCWYTRANGTRRVVEAVPKAAPAAPPKIAEPARAEMPVRLDHSVANARAEANISATAAIAPPQPEREAAPPNWQLAQRWSDHQNGGAPFETKPAAAPMSIAPPLEPAPQPAEQDEISTQRLLEIAGGAFGFAALATVLVMIFARRQQRREAASTFALFATTDDPKRMLAPRRQSDVPSQSLRPRLADDDEVPVRARVDDEEEAAMRAFTPRNMRMDRG